MTEFSDDSWTSDALERGDVDAVRRRVLSEPGYLESRDEVGSTPLLNAIALDHAELVQFLLEQGADPNVEVDDGYTSLLMAVESDEPVSLEILQNLIDRGADVRRPGINGWTPLHMAAARGDVEKARVLIDAGADINERKAVDASETPLMEAAYGGEPEMVRLLLEHGADPTMRDTVNDQTPLELARAAAAGADPAIYEILKAEYGKTDIEEVMAEMGLPPDQLEMLASELTDLDMAEVYAENANRLAETGNHAEVIRILEGS